MEESNNPKSDSEPSRFVDRSRLPASGQPEGWVRGPMEPAPSAPNERPEPVLAVRSIWVQFGGHGVPRADVLADVSIDIHRGETVAVIGESGCGKTVLLKTLVGLIRPTKGEVLLEGRPLHSLSEIELTELRLRFGFVFQGAALFDSLSIFENVAFALREHSRLSDVEIEEEVSARLREVGLSPEVLTKKPAELSGGMRKRVGFARAVALRPEIMLYDEPTTGLDPIMTDVVNELIGRMRQGRLVTSVVVTHDMSTVRKVATRVIMLYPRSRLRPGESQVLFDGPPEQLDQSPDRRVTQFVRGEAGERLMELEVAG